MSSRIVEDHIYENGLLTPSPGLIMLAGIFTIIIAVILKNSFIAAMASVGAVILTALITLVYAHKVYVSEIGSEKGGKD